MLFKKKKKKIFSLISPSALSAQNTIKNLLNLWRHKRSSAQWFKTLIQSTVINLHLSLFCRDSLLQEVQFVFCLIWTVFLIQTDLCRPLRKQNFTSMGYKGHVIWDWWILIHFVCFCVSRFIAFELKSFSSQVFFPLITETRQVQIAKVKLSIQSFQIQKKLRYRRMKTNRYISTNI